MTAARIGAVALALAAATALAWAALRGPGAGGPPPSAGGASLADAPLPPQPGLRPPPAATAAPAPRAGLRGLRGTTPSGALRTDARGHFVPGPEAVLFFEYFLSASNELPLPELVARIEAAIAARLGPPADAEAARFLADYLDYLAAGDREFEGAGVAGSADLERRMQWVRELRREHFGAELAERLFGDEEAAARLHLERRRIRDDPDLGPAERAERLAALEAEYPEAQRTARARATAPLRHAREEARLRAAGASEAEIHALREAAFGPEAAERLRALDARRAEWDRRVAAYRAERAALADGARPPSEAEIEALRAAHFGPEEARRVAILDRVEAEASAGDAGPAGVATAPATP